MKKVTIIFILLAALCCECAYADFSGQNGTVYIDTTNKFRIDCDSETGTLYIMVSGYSNKVYSYNPRQGWDELISTNYHIRDLIYHDGFIFCSTEHPFGRNCDVIVYNAITDRSKTIHPETPIYSLWAANVDELILLPSTGQGVIRYSFDNNQYVPDFEDCQYVSISDGGITNYREQDGWRFYSFDDQQLYPLSNHSNANFVTSSPSYWVDARRDRRLDIYFDDTIVYTTIPIENAAIGNRYILWYSEAESEKTLYVYDTLVQDHTEAVRSCEVSSESPIYIVDNYAAMLSYKNMFGFEITFVDLETFEIFTLSK